MTDRRHEHHGKSASEETGHSCCSAKEGHRGHTGAHHHHGDGHVHAECGHAPAVATLKDPVCGMDVDPRRSTGRSTMTSPITSALRSVRRSLKPIRHAI